MKKDHGFVRTLDGHRIFWTSWGMTEVGPEAPVVVLVHGYGEHIGRYDHVARFLNAGGLGVIGIDLRGHGQSEGARGLVYRYDEYLVDVAAAFDVASRQHPGGPRVLLGHSNGGLISVRYTLCESGQRPEYLVVSGPLLGLSIEVPGWKAALGRGLSRLRPETALPNDIEARLLSHDADIVARYGTDPLVHHVATARYFTEMQAAIEDVFQRAHTLTLPVLMMVGGEDQVVDPAGVRRLFHAVGAEDKQHIEYEGFYHEIFNETERARVLGDLQTWLAGHGLWKGGADEA